MFTTPDFIKAKASHKVLTMLACYDSWSASIAHQAGVDVLLVGDSVAMVNHGYSSTVNADSQLIETHIRSVRAGAPDAYVVGDMPFLSTRIGNAQGLKDAAAFMRAGANAVKVEGAKGHESLIPALIDAGIPVMGHLGLLPQAINLYGSYRVQGRSNPDAHRIHDEAQQLQSFGCCSLVLECIPADLAAKISQELEIPVIGIGAGAEVDGQVLVINDLLGFGEKAVPRFVRKYLEGRALMTEAIGNWVADVKVKEFPNNNESYLAKPEV